MLFHSPGVSDLLKRLVMSPSVFFYWSTAISKSRFTAYATLAILCLRSQMGVIIIYSFPFLRTHCIKYIAL